MNNKLKWFENLICAELAVIIKSNPSKELIDYQKNRINDEVKQTKDEIFKHLTVEAVSRASIKRMVWSQQKMLLRLMDKLYEQEPNFWRLNTKENPDCFRWYAYQCLHGLRLFLEEYFPSFYGSGEKASIIDRIFLSQQISDGLIQLKERFLPYRSEGVVEIMFSPLTGFLLKPEEKISLGELHYLKKYLALLLKIEVIVNRSTVLATCEKRIFRYDLNSPRVFHFFI